MGYPTYSYAIFSLQGEVVTDLYNREANLFVRTSEEKGLKYVYEANCP